MAIKIRRLDYDWPTMCGDSNDYARRCDKCQRYASMIYQLTVKLSSVTSLWIFIKWSMDIMEPFPVASGQMRFVLMMTDYFSKLVEEDALIQVQESDVEKLFEKNIICRYDCRIDYHR